MGQIARYTPIPAPMDVGAILERLEAVERHNELLLAERLRYLSEIEEMRAMIERLAKEKQN